MPQPEKVAAVVIRDGQNFYMQRRDGPNQAGALGLIGFFGGKIEKGEEPNEAASRELRQETTLFPKPSELSDLDKLSVIDNYKWIGLIPRRRRIIAHILNLKLIENPHVKATEGTLVTLDANGVEQAFKDGQLSPIAHKYFEEHPGEF